ncbi:hypothetical protein BGZ61DRAFT_376209 [Ilyonectria robusta]|uniref:uncharacterized protein n=1 Tax=Ilyonectria robusta TaxID=1079257 RepID=UPI001E8EE3D4|nr:uncharacterized protein BGZ61DRAFT_376209 [Ilyonectria robusta]KAH8649003.1 hypothetical protein BGZ61DRAFT_376209 [Ilyonectria robusta]
MTPPTQTTETCSVFPTEVLSDGCVSHGSSSTGSSDALSADSKKPDGVCFAKYCDSCQEARMSSDYAERILNLMKPLYCIACRKERPSILFSYSSRRESSAIRVCIGHQGYRPICPHLKVSFADIERWMMEGKEIEITCHEANCLASTATVCYWTSHQETKLKWTVTLDRRFSKAIVWDDCRTKLKELHQSFPAFLCPHFQTTPDRLYYPEHFERSSLATCSACRNLICLRQVGEVDRIESNWFLVSGASSMERLFKEWIEALDPDSYGHFDDQDTKCLTWCDNRYCITTCQLLHFSILTSFPAIHSISDCHAEEGREVVSHLNWKVKNRIN